MHEYMSISILRFIISSAPIILPTFSTLFIALASNSSNNLLLVMFFFSLLLLLILKIDIAVRGDCCLDIRSYMNEEDRYNMKKDIPKHITASSRYRYGIHRLFFSLNK